MGVTVLAEVLLGQVAARRWLADAAETKDTEAIQSSVGAAGPGVCAARAWCGQETCPRLA